MDLFIYKEIAKKDVKIWELFNMLNKTFNTEFAIGSDEYMEAFKEPEYAGASIKIGYDAFLDFASLYPELVIVSNLPPVNGMYSRKRCAIKFKKRETDNAIYGDSDSIFISPENAIAIGSNVTNVTFKNTKFASLAPFASEKYINNPDDFIDRVEKYTKSVNHSNIIKQKRQKEIKHFKQPKTRKHFYKH